MSIEMTLEYDHRATVAQVELTVYSAGFNGFEQGQEGLFAYHPVAGLSAWLTCDPEPRAPLAEGLAAAAWERKWLFIFRYDTDRFDGCHRTTMKFARELAHITASAFVLSFQFETVYAVKDAQGFRVIDDPSSTMAAPVS